VVLEKDYVKQNLEKIVDKVVENLTMRCILHEELRWFWKFGSLYRGYGLYWVRENQSGLCCCVMLYKARLEISESKEVRVKNGFILELENFWFKIYFHSKNIKQTKKQKQT